MAVIIRRSERITETSKSNSVTFSDFYNNFDVHPEKNDIVRKIDENAIKQSIKNLVLTDRGERFFNPNLGCDVRALLFENISPAVETSIRDLIKTTISNFEPRVRIESLIVSGQPDDNAYIVSLVFSIANNPKPITLDFILTKVR